MNRRHFISLAVNSAAFYARSAQADTLRVQLLINTAYRQGRPSVTIPPGTYKLDSGRLDAAHISLRRMQNFEIRAEGVTFILTDHRQGGLEITDCEDLAIHGATLQYEVPPASQAVITETAPDGRSARIRVEDGYPGNLDDTNYFPPHLEGYLFDPTTRAWKPRSDDLHTFPPERIGPQEFRLTWGKPALPPQFPVAQGDLIAFRGKQYQSTVTIRNGARIHINEVTIHNSSAFGVLEAEGEGGNLYTNLQIVPGGRPAGASTDPLLSSCADGLHSANMRRGPTLQNCRFAGMGDDAIAIHGTFATVLDAKDNTLIIAKSSFRAGDHLLLFDDNGVPAGEGAVTSVAPATDFHNTRKRTNKTLNDNTRGPYTRLTLDRHLGADFEYLCCTPSALGSGYVVRNNTIRAHRSRGMMLKAHDGLIEGNTIEGSTMAGIVLAPEIWWNEASYSQNVMIRNNTIDRVAEYVWPVGAIRIMAIKDVTNDKPVAGHGHQDITVENNIIRNVNGSNILITSAEHVAVRNNRFISPQTKPTNRVTGRKWLADPTTLIYMAEATDVLIEGNSVQDPGTANETELVVEPGVKLKASDWKVTVRPVPADHP